MNDMKTSTIGIFLLSIGLSLPVAAQNQSPVMQESTSTTQKRGMGQTKKQSQREALRKQQALKDTPVTKPRPLRPDSLRRGGATRVDTLR
nr:hypothetical protein [uncultured Arsenicibacter sp.]